MQRNLQTLSGEVMALPPAQRASLAHKIIESLDEGVDENAEAEWFKVIDRRIDEIECGRVKCRPVSDVVKALRRKGR